MTKIHFSIVLAIVLSGGTIFAQSADNPYKRYPLSPETRQQIWENNRESSTGQVRDPLTGKFMSSSKNWDAGHKPGYEFSKHVPSAFDRALTKKEFKAEHNTPSHYRPELPSSNRSHKLEAPRDVNKFPKPTYWQTFKKNAKPIVKFLSKIT
ncbi:MAG: HNH/ENDO VII family nuclease [Planctomycetaceae bacterium]|jgi:predicted ribonuclease toxin of YeeF-YezG toxin-antitoxin module|nr:HNH/ENDO VII family nuclease [Planctomycetaceae bacterium]